MGWTGKSPRQKTDAMDFTWLLGLDGTAERKKHGAKRKADDFLLGFAANCFLFTVYCHLMTWFARERNSGESVSPICFAALRLITNSNFVACCTGRSDGLVPLRILSTWSAARRNPSAVSDP